MLSRFSSLEPLRFVGFQIPKPVSFQTFNNYYHHFLPPVFFYIYHMAKVYTLDKAIDKIIEELKEENFDEINAKKVQEKLTKLRNYYGAECPKDGNFVKRN